MSTATSSRSGNRRSTGWRGVRVGGFLLLAVLRSVGRAEVLSLATYNVENYGPAGRMVEGVYRLDYPKPEAEKKALRSVIRAVGADVWVFQEMGPAPYLEELRRDLRAEGVDYPYSAMATAADADRHVAVLSKRPLLEVETLDLSFPYLGGVEHVKRGVIRATVKLAAGDVTIFGVHLKSRLTERPDDPDSTVRRASEATAVRDAILRRFPAPDRARFVIIGDCNDTKASKALLHLQRRGKTQVAVLLPAVDGKGETWTYFYSREDGYSRIDHILVSPALVGAVDQGHAAIFDAVSAREASDHRPVVLRLIGQ